MMALRNDRSVGRGGCLSLMPVLRRVKMRHSGGIYLVVLDFFFRFGECRDVVTGRHGLAFLSYAGQYNRRDVTNGIMMDTRSEICVIE